LARSGLRVDLSRMFNIAFAPSWKIGDTVPWVPQDPTWDPAGIDDADAPATNGSAMGDMGGMKKREQAAARVAYKDAETFRVKGRWGYQQAAKLRRLALKKRHGGPDDDEDADSDDAGPVTNIIKPVDGQQPVVRIQSGVYHQMLYDAADPSGLFPMGAQHGGVGVLGGWGQAGGHNPLAHAYGLQVDQILELEVVTADGKFVKANANENKDLFWALRGGGGGTYGIVVAGTVKIHPTPKMLVTRWFVNSTDAGLWDAIAYFHRQGKTLQDKFGIQGYYYAYPGAFQGVTHQIQEHANLDHAKAGYGPLMTEMEKLAKATHQEPKYYQYKSYKAFYDAEMGTDAMEDAGVKFLSYYDGSDGSAPSADSMMMNPALGIPFLAKSIPQKRDDAPTAPAGETPVDYDDDAPKFAGIFSFH
jgi:FAD binding domain